MSERVEVQWCTLCGARFAEEELVGATRCPKCGSTGVPCSVDRDYLVEINWHELRILGIWASNWATEKCDAGARSTLRGILSRLERQAPGAPPLTLGGEIRELRQMEGLSDLKTNIPREELVVVHGPGAVGHAKPAGVKS